MNWFKTGKGVCEGCVLSPCLLNFSAEYIMQNARLDDLQAEIKIAGRNINSLRFRVVLSAYLRLLIFLLAILILACKSSSLAFCMMYSAYTLNKQWQYTDFLYSFPNIEPVYCSMFSSNCFFLTCIQVSQETGRMVWYSCPLQNFPQIFVIHAFNAFHIVNEADALLEFPCFLYDRVNVGNLISISSAFSKSSFNI